MIDIWIAITVMMVISLLCSLVTGGVLHIREGQSSMLFIALAVLATVVFQIYVSGQLFLAQWIPSTAAVIYTNFSAFFAAAAAGWAWRVPKTPAWRRAFLALSLGLASVLATCWPLASRVLRPAPPGAAQWQGEVALQSARATCSPAAAATLLRQHGIEVDERDLVPLCLTDRSGTSTLGLYRGVKKVASENHLDVEIVDSRLDQLLEANDWPVLLAVKLPYGVEDPRYARDWGWIPGTGHSVVALGRLPGGRVVVGDPSVGIEAWSRQDLELLWHGVGLRLRPDPVD